MKDFEALYRKFAPSVYRASMRYVGRPEIAEEITSEAFLALYQQLEQVDESQLPAWLFTVAKRRAIDHWRRQVQEERTAQETFEEAVEMRAGPDFEALLRRCENLKPVHRVCLVLRYVHGMSRSEIAARIGLDELQVKGHLQYALKLLKQHFTKGAQPADADPA